MPAPTPPISPWLRRFTRWAAWWRGDTESWRRAIYRNDAEALERLWAAGVSAKNLESWDIFEALDRGPRVLRAVLGGGGDANAQHHNNHWDRLIHRVGRAGRSDLLEVLIEAGADLESKDGNQYRALTAVLDADGTPHKLSPKRRRMVRRLLAAGADPNARIHHDLTALAVAPFDSTALRLLQAGADPLALSENCNELAFHRGAEAQNVTDLKRWLKMCRRFGVPMNATDAQERTFFVRWMQTCAHGSGAWNDPLQIEAAAEAIRDAGLDLRALLSDGSTVLHDAVALTEAMTLSQQSIITWLLKQDGPWLLAQRNRDNQTALDVAQNRLGGIGEPHTRRRWETVVLQMRSAATQHHLEEALIPETPSFERSRRRRRF